MAAPCVTRKLLPISMVLAMGSGPLLIAQTLPIPSGPLTFQLYAYDRTLSVHDGNAALTLKSPLGATDSKSWSWPTGYQAVGIAGNRMLWRTPGNWTSLWLLDDAGTYVSNVWLSNPDPGNRSWLALSLGLAPTQNNAYVGGCFSRSDDQLYYVLWVSPYGDLKLDYIYGNGGRAIGAGIDIVQGLLRDSVPIGVANVLGGPAILYAYPPLHRMEIHALDSGFYPPNTLFVNPTPLSSVTYPAGYYPYSLNGAPSPSGYWNINQVLFATPNASRGMIYRFDASYGWLISTNNTKTPTKRKRVEGMSSNLFRGGGPKPNLTP